MTTIQSKLRKPTVDDAPGIAALINHFSDKGLLLPRPLNDVYERLRDFVVSEHEERLIGCAALHVVWGGLAEIRSVAVAEEARNSGVGRSLVENCLSRYEELVMFLTGLGYGVKPIQVEDLKTPSDFDRCSHVYASMGAE